MKPNILFLCIDSLKADSIFDENKTSLTPNIDFLMNKGISCIQAITSTDYTITSIASIFNSQFPIDVGVKKEKNFNVLEKNNLLESLRNYNYNIYATIPKSFVKLGLNFEFDNINPTYEDNEHKFYLSLNLGEEILKNLMSKEFKEPWAYYIHLNDLHQGTNLPEEFNEEKFGNTIYDRKISGIDIWIGKILKNINIKNTIIILFSDHGDYIRNISTKDKTLDFEFSKLRTMSWKIGKKIPSFLEPIKRKIDLKAKDILFKQKLKKINQELLPHEKRSLNLQRTDFERRLYDDIVHIPIIFAGYNFSKKSIVEQIRSIDIFPTLTEILKIPIDQKKIQGKSIIPLFNGKKVDEQVAYMESSIYAISDKFKDLTEPVIGIRTAQYKYFRKIKDPSEKYLFDLINDPKEEENISKSNPNIIEKMEETIQQIRNKMTEETEEMTEEMTEEETEEVEKELKKLGYI